MSGGQDEGWKHTAGTKKLTFCCFIAACYFLCQEAVQKDRLLIISCWMKRKNKSLSLSSGGSFGLCFYSSQRLHVSSSRPRTLLPLFVFSLFVLLLYIICCLAENYLCEVKNKSPATVTDGAIIGVNILWWWITITTVLIWVFVGPDCSRLAQSAVFEF